MRFRSKQSSLEAEANAIETKRKLLAYICSEPKRLTIESYICLTRILTAAGWRFDQDSWYDGELRLPTLEAAAVELERQIKIDRERLLRKTVGNYGPALPRIS